MPELSNENEPMRFRSFSLNVMTAIVGAASTCVALAGGIYVNEYNFPAPSVTTSTSPGSFPASRLTYSPSSSYLYGVTPTGGPGGGGTLFRTYGGGQAATPLRSFGGSGDVNGSSPNGPLLLASGSLFGVHRTGGTNAKGVLYRFTPPSAYTVLHHFGGGVNGETPSGQLVLASNGYVYGTTRYGGTCGRGSIYRFPLATPTSVTTAYSFCGSDGYNPMTGVIQATDGNLYGTAYGGGDYDRGTLFRLNPATNGFAKLHSFGSGIGTPVYPTALVQGSDGLLYGASYRGSNVFPDVTLGAGTIFSSTLAGQVTVRAFMGNIGVRPFPTSALLERFNGIFYGVGEEAQGQIFQFRASNNTVTLVKGFSGEPNLRGWPRSGLIVGPGGNLWGATDDNEYTFTGNFGSLFSIQQLTANP